MTYLKAIAKRFTCADVVTLAKRATFFFAVNGLLLYCVLTFDRLPATSNLTVSGFAYLLQAAGILLQPWSIACLILAVFCCTSDYYQIVMLVVSTSLLSLLIYPVLLRSQQGQRLVVFYRRPQTRVAAAVTFALLILVALSEYKDFPARRMTIASEPRLDDSLPSGALSCQLYWAAEWNPLHYGYQPGWKLFRQVIAADKVDGQVRLLGLRRIATPTAIPAQFARQAPYWWQPRLSRTSIVYQRVGDSSGQSSAYAVYNPPDQTLYYRERTY